LRPIRCTISHINSGSLNKSNRRRKMSQSDKDEIRRVVRGRYGGIAEVTTNCCAGTTPSCCGMGDGPTLEDISVALGYSKEQVSTVPDGSNMGLGCGNPHAIASLKEGEIVLDLGSGGGFDCFLAARAVGETGHVIGVDLTPEMVSKARRNAASGGFTNVEFRLGEIENLPVADNSVDVIISNCVINLSPEKPKVFREAFRVLKLGGRLAVSDVVATAQLPDEVKGDVELHAGCIAGASSMDQLEHMLREAGFADIRIQPKDESREFIRDWAPGIDVGDFVVSANIEAVKPAYCSQSVGEV
jgi:SAM-dependent methyltransferase